MLFQIGNAGWNLWGWIWEEASRLIAHPTTHSTSWQDEARHVALDQWGWGWGCYRCVQDTFARVQFLSLYLCGFVWQHSFTKTWQQRLHNLSQNCSFCHIMVCHKTVLYSSTSITKPFVLVGKPNINLTKSNNAYSEFLENPQTPLTELQNLFQNPYETYCFSIAKLIETL